MTVGDRIKQLRIERHVTQEELAKYLDTSKQTIFKYENNIVTNIPLDKIEKIATFFNISPPALMGWNEQQNEKDAAELSDLQYALYNETKDVSDETLKSIIQFARFAAKDMEKKKESKEK